MILPYMQKITKIDFMNEFPITGSQILISPKENSSVYEDGEYRIYWEGLVFIPGIPSGLESVSAFLQAISAEGIQDACRFLKGVFFILIETKTKGDLYAFVDNSGLYQAFHAGDILSTSFLSLAKHEKLRVSDIDPEAIVEFLRLGNIFSNRTFFRHVRKFSWDSIYHISGKELNVIPKNITSMDSESEVKDGDLERNFEEQAKSLRNCSLSIDLTGGNDSRLLAVLLDLYGLKYETAISGGNADYKDVSISKKIAHSLGRPWFATIHSVSSLEADMPKLFTITEGMYDILYYHRLYQLQKERKARGVDTIISGMGGELFKDYWWLQDFPFYSRKHSNIERLVDMRIVTSMPLDHMLTKRYSILSSEFRNKVVKELSSYIRKTNTETYDSIYYHYMMREIAGRVLTAHNSLLKCYAPFLDPSIAMIGFNLPRSQRFFNIYHRRIMTKINPSISRLPTTEGGMSASVSPLDLISDVPKYVMDRSKRLLIKLGVLNVQKATRDNPNLKTSVRNMNIMKESLDILREVKIINNHITLEQIDDGSLGMILTLGMFVNFLENKD